MSKPTFPQNLLRALLWPLAFGAIVAAAFGFLLDQLLLGGRIRWFNPFTVVTYTITASDLLAHRAYFERRLRPNPSAPDEPAET